MDFQDARAAQSKESQTSQHGSRRAFLIWPGTWRMQRCLLDASGEGRWRQWEGQIQGPQDKTESSAENEESCLWRTIWLRGRREEKNLSNSKSSKPKGNDWKVCNLGVPWPRTAWKPEQRRAQVTVGIPLQKAIEAMGMMTMAINVSDPRSKKTTLLLHQHQCTRSTSPRTGLCSCVAKTRLISQLVETLPLSTGSVGLGQGL